MLLIPDGLSALCSFNQFILYRLIPQEDGSVTKKPSSPQGYDINPHEAEHWLSFEEASQINANTEAVHGIGFVLTKLDPFFFVDIDKCAMPDGQWSPMALDLCKIFAGAGVEISQSGTGLHIIGRGMAPPHWKKNKDLNLEFYTELRFIALTGKGVTGDASTDHTVALSTFVPNFAPLNWGGEVDLEAEWTHEPVEGWCGPENDDDLIAKMLDTAHRNATFSNKTNLIDLWECKEERLAIAYPDQSDAQSYGRSEADAALASHLAFWTGSNCERIDALMRRSALVRDKWDDHPSYMRLTISRAAARCSSAYTNKRPEPEIRPASEGETIDTDVAGFQFLTVDRQVEHFEGCIYVTDSHMVYTPWGDLLKPDRFKARFGGYEFALDNSNQKSTRSAFDAFTESQGFKFPKVDGEAFRPLRPTGEIFEQDGRSYVNTYYEIKTPRTMGDPQPFLDHLAKVLPDENDRAILLAYMAACIQYKGVKFDWCPLIQGVEGNGKTLFTRVVRFCIGNRYSHMPKASKLDSEFNAWILRSIFVGVEDIYVPGHKQDVMNTIKPMITGGDGLEIQKKGVDQVTDEICANFILNCNPKNGVPKTENDRRFCPLFTAQQSKADLLRDGMPEDGDYFSKLYGWLNEKGYSILNEYLCTYAIPDALNPATNCRRAPITTSTDEAIRESLGGVEQEILEAIEEGQPGFAGGWVSSLALERFLSRMGKTAKITPNKRWEMLKALGYVQHPHLARGRTNSATMTDNGKPRLFVKEGHLALNLTQALEIAKAYDAAQTPEQQTTLAGRAFAHE